MLMLSVLTVSLFSQDRKISGIINEYKSVAAIGPGLNNITLSDVSNIAAEDTVLLIQMKGAIILEAGGFREPVGAPGSYEFLIVQSVDIGTRVVVFTNPILNSYDIKGLVQLVTVPSYTSATVKGTLTCQPWDSISKTGGVLTMIVGRTLSLNANIDVAGKGFFGGAVPPTASPGICSSNPTYDDFNYPITYTNSGFKGESPVLRVWIDFTNIPSINPNYSKGKGRSYTGGGGGNGKYSGGGGGASFYSTGGSGGFEPNPGCTTPYSGGVGGKQINSDVELGGKILLGSGGGGSTYESAPTASAGGKGGGIIIIMCETLKGKGKIISADGVIPGTTASGNAGAGGGGGGGSIALYQQSFSTPLDSSLLTISAKGGKGGNTSNLYGEGGGGGGGFILTNNPADPGNVTKITTGGAGGTRSNATTGFSGTAGMALTTFAPTLNGFLFNSIKSEVTGNLVDSICSNVPFGTILGTKPVGGVEGTGYHFEWQYSTLANPLDLDYLPASGVNNLQDYSPGLLTVTTWFRRVVTDNGLPVLIDKSTPIQIIVQQAITGNLIGKDTTICYNQNPFPLVPLNAGPSNGSSLNYYLYKWIQNTTNTSWGETTPNATGTFNNPSYDSPALTQTTYFQRVVTSGRCVNYSSTVTITVLPLITENITTRPDSVICEGSLFNNLGASAPVGGDLTYKYQWQDSINSSVWMPAVGLNTAAGYTPDTSTFSAIENRYFRRVVFSGPDSVCKSRSVPILLTRYHKIKTNLIAADQTICSETSPVPLTGSIPTQGKAGDYAYVWQDSVRTGIWIQRATTDFSHAPGNLTDTTWYRRIVISSVCADTSLTVRINVHKLIAENNISVIAGGLTDTTICNGQIPHLLKGSAPTGGTNIPGSYLFKWYSSIDNVTYIPVATAGTGINYQPPALSDTTYYKREVTSGTCSGFSDPVIVKVLPLITNNVISSDRTVCYNTDTVKLTGATPLGGAGIGTYIYFWEQSSDGGTTWLAASGTNNDASGKYFPPALPIPMKFRRTATSGLSGCCTNVSNEVLISQYPPLPTGKITNIADTTICGGLQVLLEVELTGVSPWKVTYKENAVQGAAISTAIATPTFTATPASASALDIYNYSLLTVEDANGCKATSLAGGKKANVYKVPDTKAGPDQLVCGPTVNLAAVPDAGTGIWKYPSAVVSSTANAANVTVTIDDVYINGKITHNFIWEETNWTCKSQDAVDITFYKKISSIDAGPDTTLYSFDNIFHMSANMPEVWEVGLWSIVSGGGSFDNESLYNSVVTSLEPKVSNVFKWVITNGECTAEDVVNVYVDEIMIPEGFSPNGDGVNDIFEVQGLDLENQDAELKIINSTGSEVFSTYKFGTDKGTWSPWDGKSSNGYNLPEGTYYYLLKLTSLGNGKIHKKSGFIILKRF
jgi:gliding motility-associated-like protein